MVLAGDIAKGALAILVAQWLGVSLIIVFIADWRRSSGITGRFLSSSAAVRGERQSSGIFRPHTCLYTRCIRDNGFDRLSHQQPEALDDGRFHRFAVSAVGLRGTGKYYRLFGRFAAAYRVTHPSFHRQRAPKTRRRARTS